MCAWHTRYYRTDMLEKNASNTKQTRTYVPRMLRDAFATMLVTLRLWTKSEIDPSRVVCSARNASVSRDEMDQKWTYDTDVSVKKCRTVAKSKCATLRTFVRANITARDE